MPNVSVPECIDCVFAAARFVRDNLRYRCQSHANEGAAYRCNPGVSVIVLAGLAKVQVFANLTLRSSDQKIPTMGELEGCPWLT